MSRLNLYLLALALSIIVLSCKDEAAAVCDDPITCPVQRIEWIDGNDEIFQAAVMTYDEIGNIVSYSVDIGEALNYRFYITRSEDVDLITIVSTRSDGFESSQSLTSIRHDDSILVTGDSGLVITLTTQDNQLVAYKKENTDVESNTSSSTFTYRPDRQVVASQSNEVLTADSTAIELWRYDYSGESMIAPPLPFNPMYGWGSSNVGADLLYLLDISLGPAAPSSHIRYDTPGSEGQLISTITTTRVTDNIIDIAYDQHGQRDNYTIRLHY